MLTPPPWHPADLVLSLDQRPAFAEVEPGERAAVPPGWLAEVAVMLDQDPAEVLTP